MSLKKVFSDLVTLYYQKFVDENLSAKTFPGHLGDRKRMLIVLPRDPEERSIFLSSLDKILKFSENYEITFAGIEIPDFDLKGIENVFVFDKKQVFFGFFPKMEAIEKCSKKIFDLSLDTNVTFDLGSALIPLRAGIATRIGFAKDYGSPFYNIGFWGDSISEFTKFWKDVTGAEKN